MTETSRTASWTWRWAEAILARLSQFVALLDQAPLA